MWRSPCGATPGPFPRAAAAKTLASALKNTSVVRVVADPGRARKVKKVEAISGKGCWEEEVAGSRLLLSAPSFAQVNTAQAEKLVELVLAGLEVDAGDYVADLYAGAGTFTLPLAAAGACVVAVESAGSSVRDLRRNAERAGADIRHYRRGRRPGAARAGRAGRARWWIRRARDLPTGSWPPSPPPRRGAWPTSAATRPPGPATWPVSRRRATALSASPPSTSFRRPTMWKWLAFSQQVRLLTC